MQTPQQPRSGGHPSKYKQKLARGERGDHAKQPSPHASPVLDLSREYAAFCASWENYPMVLYGTPHTN